MGFRPGGLPCGPGAPMLQAQICILGENRMWLLLCQQVPKGAAFLEHAVRTSPGEAHSCEVPVTALLLWEHEQAY